MSAKRLEVASATPPSPPVTEYTWAQINATGNSVLIPPRPKISSSSLHNENIIDQDALPKGEGERSREKGHEKLKEPNKRLEEGDAIFMKLKAKLEVSSSALSKQKPRT